MKNQEFLPLVANFLQFVMCSIVDLGGKEAG